MRAQRSLAQFLYDQMERRGLETPAELAKIIDVHPETASRLLAGEGMPRELTMEKIATAFHVPVSVVHDLVRPPLATFLMSQLGKPGLDSTKKLGEFIGIAQGTAYRLSRGLTIPTQETLRKVADAFELPITEVQAMARRPVGDPEPFAWPAEFEQLTRLERETLLEVGRRFIEAHGLGRVTR